MHDNYLRLLLAAGCIACAIPVQGAERSAYPTVETPTVHAESYYPGVRPVEDQTQAAYLLVLLNLADPVEGVAPGDMAPPEHLQEIGIDPGLLALSPLREPSWSLDRIAARYALPTSPVATLSNDLVARQRALAREVARGADPASIAELAVISFHHPDPLVRVAAAPLVLVTTDGEDQAVDTLRQGVMSEDDRVRRLALTLLARYRPRDPALDPWRGAPPRDPGQKEEPNTTLVIHGTWARDNDWWQDDGDFFEYLQHDVAIDDLFLGDDPFAWSGDWDHDQRLVAADELETWMSDHGETCVDIIAHSHGANVAFLAAPSLDYGRLVVLSTPSHRTRYPTDPDTPILSVRVKLDLVVLADGGGNKFPVAPNITEKYIGWFNHSATHHPNEWEQDAIAGMMPPGRCAP